MRKAIIHLFAQHPVAPNLLMLLMLLVGAVALTKMNAQFLPSFSVDFINIRVIWPGATAEDTETGITDVIEAELEDIDNVKKISSISSLGFTSIFIEYEEGSDMGKALNEVTEAVSRIRNLPEGAEKPQITLLEQREQIARMVISGPTDRVELRRLAKRLERQLLERGINRIETDGMPEEEIAIQLPAARMVELGLSMRDIAQQIGARSRDLPAGEVGSGAVGHQLRSLDQKRSPADYADLRVTSRDRNQTLRLGDIADVERRAQKGEITMQYRGEPAVMLSLFRAETENTLDAAETFNSWLEETRPTLPPNIKLTVFDERYTLLIQRINLLLKNGLGGLVLIIIILFLFLKTGVAFWVTVGIPVSFMATLAVLYLAGGTINMVSLFALIMALGIIVDDAIVVGEDALAHYQMGEDPLTAAEGGAERMLAPVMSSSMTTIAAFIPLMLIGGIMGAIMFTIPLVIICVVIASIIECFLILPGHLRGTFIKMQNSQPSRFRQKMEDGFDRFRDNVFRPFITRAIHNKGASLCIAFACLMIVFGIAAGGRLKFNFFPQPENPVLLCNITFVAGTPRDQIDAFVSHVDDALYQTEADLGGNLVATSVTEQGRILAGGGRFTRAGDQFALVRVELVAADERTVRNRQFITEWQKRIKTAPGLEDLVIFSPRGGPPGRDVEISLRGENIDNLKKASEELQAVLESMEGVSGVGDNTPYGREQLIYKLTPQAESLGLSVSQIGGQLRAAYDGAIVQFFTELGDEIEVRVLLDEHERQSSTLLETLPIVLDDGSTLPLSSLVTLDTRRGFETVRHTNRKLAVEVSATVDPILNNATEVNLQLEREILPKLEQKYNLRYVFEGRHEDQTETVGEMRVGALLALSLIYIVLAWIFSSYGWPLLVMIIIPFGIAGAIFGHWLLGLEVTLLSLFGLFALSGIVVNDSIILVVFYKELREKGKTIKEALIDAACLRLRAVMLTSMTTIAGLIPLMFETSLQAQFLIPMAVSLTFGLAFATLLVLVVIPCLLGVYESTSLKIGRWRTESD